MQKQSFDKASLRGYGEVSGAFWLNARGGSILEVDCQDADKAKLLQAKYLSDAQTLPGVQPQDMPVGNVSLEGLQIDGQGIVAALRSDQKVFIVAAPTAVEFASLVSRGLSGSLGSASSRPETEVPMFLDRWDRFGFRFYYGYPWSYPSSVSMDQAALAANSQNYDITKEFDYAAQMDRSGFVMWGRPNVIDTAEGMTNEVWWDWAAKAANAAHVPIGINLMITESQGNPPWLFNHYRDQTETKMPQFFGGGYVTRKPTMDSGGEISRSATVGMDEQLGVVQDIVRRAAALPSVTTFLEPHGELSDIRSYMVEYGPLADASYRKYLEEKYATIQGLNASWLTKYASWDEVKAPELASFEGWGPDAFDLTGDWHVNFDKQPVAAGAPVWYSEQLDDSHWPVIPAPGNDIDLFVPQRGAIYRRTFEVSREWLSAHPKVWLYVWDAATGTKKEVVLAGLNGQLIGSSVIEGNMPHWGAFDTGSLLRAGSNQLSLTLPNGILGYRIYLSSNPPKQYPDLGSSLNAQWADFVGWSLQSVYDEVGRGMEMIRQVDRNRQIDLMAPNHYMDGIRRLAKMYGGNFKNTGSMGGFWNDELPAVMRGAGLPMSVEPGGPAGSVPDFQKHLGLWSTEGVQGLDYFIHIGSILWHPDIKQFFEENLKIFKLFGKYHAPPAQVAVLYATKGSEMLNYPWVPRSEFADPNVAMGAAYWYWNVRANLQGLYESDALTESSFSEGDAARYRVIIDSNTSIMDDKLLSDIEQFIRDGGTFVTIAQTGRHAESQPDSWPISRLTGYRVTKISPVQKDGLVAVGEGLRPAPDQNAFTGDWSNVKANGLTLQSAAPDTKNLMLWPDGSVAVGMRQIGKGYIIQVGCKFTGDHIPDRFDSEDPLATKASTNTPLTRLLTQLLAWRGVSPVPVSVEPPSKDIIMRHYLSNNGLYDVWMLWNETAASSLTLAVRSDKNGIAALTEKINGMPGYTGVLALKDGLAPPWAIVVKDGQKVLLNNNQIAINLRPLETAVWLTPRNQIANAPLEWFELQRQWWQGTTAPSSTPLPAPPHRFSVDLMGDWMFKPLDINEDGQKYVTSAGADAGTWERRRFGVWNIPDHRDVRRALFLKTFTVPAGWTNGEATLWIRSLNGPAFADSGRIWLDGKLISDWSPNAVVDVNPENSLKAGTSHTLAIEIKGAGSLEGPKSSVWLWYWPNPESTLDLSGDWTPSIDALNYTAPIRLPGPYNGIHTLRRTIAVPADQKGRNVVLDLQAAKSVGLDGVIVNGTWVHEVGSISPDRCQINITPWIRFGQENTLELVCLNGVRNGDLKNVALNFYEAGVYP